MRAKVQRQKVQKYDSRFVKRSRSHSKTNLGINREDPGNENRKSQNESAQNSSDRHRCRPKGLDWLAYQTQRRSECNVTLMDGRSVAHQTLYKNWKKDLNPSAPALDL